MNFCMCCVPCCHLNSAKNKLDDDLRKALPDIEADFTPAELAQLTKMDQGQFVTGNRVEAQWSKGIDEWHPAVIKQVKDDGTFVIEWEDGVKSDIEKTAKQLRPWYGMGTFKELWVQLDENHDGKIDKSEFLRLGPKALRDSFEALVLQEQGVLAGLVTASGVGGVGGVGGGVDRLAARQELVPVAAQM